MTGLTTDSACELIKGNKEQDRASTRKSSYAANFFFEAFFVKNVSNDGLAVAGKKGRMIAVVRAIPDQEISRLCTHFRITVRFCGVTHNRES